MNQYTITTNVDDGDNYEEVSPMSVPGHGGQAGSWVTPQTIGAFDTTFIKNNLLWFGIAAVGALILLFALTRQSD